MRRMASRPLQEYEKAYLQTEQIVSGLGPAREQEELSDEKQKHVR